MGIFKAEGIWNSGGQGRVPGIRVSVMAGTSAWLKRQVLRQRREKFSLQRTRSCHQGPVSQAKGFDLLQQIMGSY